jgi:hypothetical protein
VALQCPGEDDKKNVLLEARFGQGDLDLEQAKVPGALFWVKMKKA